ncbi:DUF3800 domain-containing protein [Methylorubrum extorquens]
MRDAFNIYCDESCHLERDGHRAMVLGAVWCPIEKRREISKRLREINVRHGMPADFEVKWTKVGPSKLRLYMDYIDYFFDDDDFCFRALVVPDKTILRHEDFGQDHDGFYYKTYFNMLKVLLSPSSQHRIYIDIKDTRGYEKIEKLHEVLCNNAYDFSRQIIERVQRVRSHEVPQLQMADLLIGALSYLHRGLGESSAKSAIISRIRERSGYSLLKNTLVTEKKVNILVWRGAEV